jgi:transcription antitermination factor NusG
MLQTILATTPAISRAEPTLSLGARAGIEYFEPHWYAAYTCANHEKCVALQLERRSVECFLPCYESVRRWKDRRVRLRLPLFPGYIFVRLALHDRLQVLEIPGLVRLVGFAGHPTRLPVEEIAMIRTCLARRQFLEPCRYVRCGQRVRVLSGPLEGLSGIVVRQKNRTRFVISLELLMRSVSVEINSADLDPRAALPT